LHAITIIAGEIIIPHHAFGMELIRFEPIAIRQFTEAKERKVHDMHNILRKMILILIISMKSFHAVMSIKGFSCFAKRQFAI